MKEKIKKLLLTAAILVSGIAGAAGADLAGRINGIIHQGSQKNVEFSVSIIKAETGERVYGFNENRPLIPASNMKMVITAAALKYLGADYEYQTRTGLSDRALVVIGAGDPLLADKETDARYGRAAGWVIEDIITALRQNGVTAVKNIIIDSSIFDDERVHPNWRSEETNKWYACQISGLNYNENCIEVTVEAVKGKVNFTVEPQTSYVKVVNECKAASKPPDTVWCSRTAGTNEITMRGKCYRKCQPVKVAVERPTAFFAFLLAENIAKAGITVEGQFIEKQTEADKKIKELRTYKTKLIDVLKRCNKDSFNLAAEALLKTIAANNRADKKNGGWEKGREEISNYLEGLGVKENEFYIDDGCGLSRENKLSANALTTVLLSVYKSKDWPIYKESLAEGGTDGTIEKYFKEKKYQGKICGKTGYINGVKSFSGVCTASGKDYIFSILTNKAGSKTRDAINDIAKAIVDNIEK